MAATMWNWRWKRKMKTKDFFILTIKLFGLYCLAIAIFTYLPNSISYLVSSFVLEDQSALVLSVLVLLFSLTLFYVLIKKADKIVVLLKIDQGFEVDFIDLGKMKEATIFKLALILLGLYLFIEELPYFINTTLNKLQVETFESTFEENNSENFVWVFSLLKIFTALFLLLNYKFIQEKLFTSSEEKN